MTGVPSHHCKKKKKIPKPKNLLLVGDRTLVPHQMNQNNPAENSNQGGKMEAGGQILTAFVTNVELEKTGLG